MTYIRRLELRGFKSSGPKTTVINFEKGFTVITGPNGSGKSNIADAIAFAIGENSPKALRAGNGRLPGLIYDPKGGDTPGASKPTTCRVTLQFDNSDREIPVDSDLVTVTRELKDDGENVYYLNGRKSTRTSLADILELAGLTPGGFNIVAQGAATRVADLSPEEKRKLVEGLVGISRFDEKKAEAQRQLGQADHRLEVAMARIGEMKGTLEALDSQRTELVRFNLLGDQINWLTAVGTSKRIAELRERVSSLKAQEAEEEARVAELSARVAEYERRVSQVEDEKYKFIRDVVQGGSSGPIDLQLQLTDVRNELSSLEEELKSAQEYVAQLEGETVPQLKQTVSSKQREVNAASSNVRGLTDDISKLDAKHTELKERLKQHFLAGEELRGTIEKRARQSARVQVKIADVGEKLAQAELATKAAEASLGVEKKRLDELKLRVDGYSQVLEKIESDTAELSRLSEGSTKELGAIEDRLAAAQETRDRLVDSIDGASKILQRATAELSREEAFRHLSESMAGERSGQTKLQELCDGGGVPGYVGRLGQLVRYPPDYAKAVNAVMGRWLGAFVVQDLKSMTRLIRAAKSVKAKAFSVIPLSEVSGTRGLEFERSAGVVGPLARVLKCDPEFEGLVNFLAGDAVVVETEAIGYIVASEGVRAVTATGETFEPGGKAFTFGYQEMMVNLMEGLENIEGMGEIEDAVGALRGAIERRRSELGALETDTRGMMKDRVKRIVSVTSLRAEATTITKLANRYRSIFRAIASEYQKQEGVVKRMEAKLSVSEARRDSMARGMAALRQSLADTQALGLDQMLAELEGAKQSLSSEVDSVRGRISDLDLALSREKSNLENVLRRALEENESDLAAATEDLKTHKEFARESPRRVRELSEQKERLEEDIRKLLESSKRSQPVIDEYDGRIRRLKEERDSASRSVASAQKEAAGVSSQVGYATEKLEEALGSLRMLGYQEELRVFDGSDEMLSALRAEYDNVSGSVNRSADKQYSDMYVSYKSLSVRNNELERERNSIVEFIQKVEAERKGVFGTGFDKVNSTFRSIFSTLAEGTAELRLEDPDDIFSGGVLMYADFGNGMRESSQHSGGQRAVVGVSMILAMQSVQTHPFYLFDEIDAGLDAVNSARLARLLREKSGEAQMIAITLRDTFVADSSITYGVYSAGGVSRVVHYRPAGVPAGG